MMTSKINELAISLSHLLKKTKRTISCAESCTGGGLAFAITSVAGSSTWFKQSYVTYCNEAKSELLGVKQQTLNDVGAVSKQTVEQMVFGCAEATSADVAVSISGIAGPDGGSDEKPVGLVWFGFFVKGEVNCEHRVFNGNREAVRLQAIEFALQTIVDRIENPN